MKEKRILFVLTLFLLGLSFERSSSSAQVVGDDSRRGLADKIQLWKAVARAAPEVAWIVPAGGGGRPADSGGRDSVRFADVASFATGDKDLFHTSNLNQCISDALLMLTGLRGDSGMWALEMLDAWGKLPSGLLRGATMWPGNYEECKSVVVNSTIFVNSSKSFQPQYCQATMSQSNQSNTGLPMGELTIGLCIPSSCSPDDLTSIASIIKTFLGKQGNFMKLSKATCPQESTPLEAGSIVMICLLSVLLFVLVVGTLIDLNRRFFRISLKKSTFERMIAENLEDTTSSSSARPSDGVETASVNMDAQEQQDTTKLVFSSDNQSPEGTFEKIFLCFSVYTNAAKLLDTSKTKGEISCLHGIRFLSMAWVILAHAMMMGYQVVDNLVDIINVFDLWTFQAMLNGTYSVDTFFLLSGALTSYLYFKSASKPEFKMSWPLFYFHRFWRLTPAYMLVLAFIATLFIHTGSGPFWSSNDLLVQSCQKHWWWNLLYINNFQNMADMCMGWSWFLANDIQFFIISPILLISLFRCPKLGYVLCGILLLVSVGTREVLSLVNNFRPLFTSLGAGTTLVDAAKIQDFFDKLYITPWSRIATFLIGILLGVILFKTEHKKRFLEWKWLIMGWLTSAATALVTIYSVHYTMPEEFGSSVYIALGRSAFALSVGWVIFACATGHAGFVDTFLSWSFWKPLGRLTYCAYLVHPLVTYWFFFTRTTTVHFSLTNMSAFYCFILMVSYGVAFVVSVVSESPLLSLEKVLLKKR